MAAELAQEVGDRRARLADGMERERVDAVVVASESNFVYLTGYVTNAWSNRARPLCLVVGPDGEAAAVISAGEAERLERDGVRVRARPYRDPLVVSGSRAIELDFMSAAVVEVESELRRLGARTVGFELSSQFVPGLAPATLDGLRGRIGSEAARDISPALWELRRHKSSYEIGLLRRAAAVLGSAFDRFEERARPEMTERELHRLFVLEAATAGADRVPYTNVIADIEVGPLGGASDRRWDEGRLLLFDAGVVVDGYWADFGRMYAAAAVSAEQEEAYASLTAALARGREAARPGAEARELAAAVVGASLGEAEPYGRVGHGVGLDITEPPSLHRDDPTILEEGMTLCIEPNQHVSGVGYLAGEEEILVTSAGAELLSPPFPTEPRLLR
jgi:Xaa-Pro aminopeptidase